MAHERRTDTSASADVARAGVHDAVPGEPPLEASRASTTLPHIVRARDDVTDAVHTPSGTSANLQRSRRRRIRRRVVRGAAVVVAAGVVYFAVTLFQVWSTGRIDSSEPVDAIVVMGAAQYDGRPSPQLAARLDHVVALWPSGLAPVVVVTGGNIPGDRFTEAEASAGYLIERGVTESAIVLEDEGTNSFESLEAVREILAERGMSDILVVTDPYHALRSRMIAEEVGLTASVSSTDTSVVTGGASLARHVKEAGGVSIGRIIGFERLAEIVD